MKRSTLRLLACPGCGGKLRPGDTEGAEPIDTGSLVCEECGLSIPIRGGIPRFPLDAEPAAAAVTQRTSRMYKFAWRRFGRLGHEAGQKDSFKFTALIPPGLLGGPGRVGLDAGCGAGQDLVRIARGGAELLALDVSEGVDIAKQLCAGLPNVDLVQADLNAPPFRSASFDFIYSFGVLHHLADTERGFRNLSRLLKPGGSLITYMYEDFGSHTRLERALIELVRWARRLTTRMPPALLYGACWLAAPLVWTSCSVPAHLLRPVAPRLAGRIPFRHTLRWDALVAELYDRMSPPIERRYTRAQVEDMYARAGLTDVSIQWFRGWVGWGRKPDERGARVDIAV